MNEHDISADDLAAIFRTDTPTAAQLGIPSVGDLFLWVTGYSTFVIVEVADPALDDRFTAQMVRFYVWSPTPTEAIKVSNKTFNVRGYRFVLYGGMFIESMVSRLWTDRFERKLLVPLQQVSDERIVDIMNRSTASC